MDHTDNSAERAAQLDAIFSGIRESQAAARNAESAAIRTETKIEGINERLDVVNGRLGKHSEHLSQIDVRCAERRGVSEGRQAANAQWEKFLTPAMRAVLAGLVLLASYNHGKLFELLKPLMDFTVSGHP